MSDELFIRPRYSPPHLFRPNAWYFVTAKSLEGVNHMAQPTRRQAVVEALQFACERRGWSLDAWVVLPNHYHCLLVAPDEARDLSALLASVHRYTATQWNRADGKPRRPVWYRYWDSCISHESSLWARLNYIHYNPVRHGLVASPEAYAFSSYRQWALATDLRELEAAFPWDRLELEF